MSSSSTDFDPRALTQGPRHPGHARRQGPAQLGRGAREEGELIQINIDPSVLEDWGRELRRANRGKAGEPYSHHYPESFMELLAFLYSGSSSTSHALGADRGVRALPLRVRGGRWTAAPDY